MSATETLTLNQLESHLWASANILRGPEDFEIIRGDTLANPTYSVKQWNREAWGSDKWGRNSPWDQWEADGGTFWQQMDALVETLDGSSKDEGAHA